MPHLGTKAYAYTALSLATLLSATACGENGGEGDESFGQEPITILSSSAVGSPVDVMARALADEIDEQVSANVTVENLEGGGGEVALQRLVDSEPDGNTLYAMTQSQAVLFATEQLGDMEPADLDFIARMQEDPFIWATNADSEYQNLQDLVEADQVPSVGGFGAVSAHSLAGQDIAEELGLDIDWAAFDGGDEALTATLGGHLDVVNTNPGIVREYYEDGTLNVLAVATEEELDIIPGVPTFIDEGVDYTGAQWRGIVAPAGVPEEIQTELADAFNNAFESERFQDLLEEQGVLGSYLELEDFEDFVMDDIAELADTTDSTD